MDENIHQNFTAVLTSSLEIEAGIRAFSRMSVSNMAFDQERLKDLIESMIALEQLLADATEHWHLLYLEGSDPPEQLESTKETADSDLGVVIDNVVYAIEVMTDVANRDFDGVTALSLLSIADDFSSITNILDVWQFS